MLEVTRYESEYITKIESSNNSKSVVTVIHLDSRLSCTCSVYTSPYKNKCLAIEAIEMELKDRKLNFSS